MGNEPQQTTFEYQQGLDPSLVKHLVDFEEVIDSLRLIFSGKDIDYSQTPPKMVVFGQPIMNEYGIGRVVTKLKGIHKGIPMGTFDKSTPYTYARIMGINLFKELFRHLEYWGADNHYGIKDTTDADKVIEAVVSSILAAYSRGVAGSEKNFIKGFARESRDSSLQSGRKFSL